MNSQDTGFNRHDLPFLAILTLPVACMTLGYFLFSGNDIESTARFIFPLNNDNFRFMLPKLEIIQRIITQGSMPFWNPYQGFGIELWSTLGKAPFSGLLLAWLSPMSTMILIGHVHLITAQLIFYFFGRQLGLSRQAACISAVTYALSGYFIAYVYDHAILGAAQWTVGILACYLCWRRNQRLWPLVLGAICTALTLVYGRATDTLYFLVFFLTWQVLDARLSPISDSPFKDFLRTATTMLLMGIAGLALAAPFMFPFVAYLLEGSRELTAAIAEKTEYMRFDHLHGLFVPTYQTGTARFVALAAAPFWLSALFSRSPSPLVRLFRWTLLIILLLQIPLGLFDLVRMLPSQAGSWSPVRFMSIALLSVATLTGMGFDTLFPRGILSVLGRQRLKQALIGLSLAAGVFLIVVLVTAQTQWTVWDYVGVNRKDLNTRLGFGTWLMILMTMAAWWMTLKKPKHAFAFLLLAIVPALFFSTQSGNAHQRKINLLAKHESLQSSETLKRFKAISDPYSFRVHNLADSLYANRLFWSEKGIQSDFSYEMAEPVEPYSIRQFLWYQGQYYRNWFNAGNIRFLVGEKGRTPKWAGATYSKAWTDDAAKLTVFENPDYWPRVYMTSDVREVPNPIAQRTLLAEPGALPPRVALVSDADSVSITSDAQGEARVVSYDASRVEIECKAEGDMILVLSDRMAHGWTAKLDTDDVPILTANYLFRGIPVPAGEHRIVFTYRPPGLDAGLIAAAVSALCLMLALLMDIKRHAPGRITS